MAYTLSEDEALIAKVVGEFARDQITLNTAQELDRHDRFPAEQIAAAAGLGLMGMVLDADEGGAGAGPTAYALALEELAKVCVNTAAVIATHNLGLRLLRRGDKARLAGPAAGEVVSVLATEEAHASDKRTLGTDAMPDGDGYRITGMKVWATGAAGAKHFVVLASVPEAGPTLFHVPADADGITLGQNEPLMGLRASGIRTVYLSGVHVGADEVLGEPGQGADILATEMPWLVCGVAAITTGATAGGFEAARQFAESRVQFGKPIGLYQAVSDMVTDMDMHVHAARALTLAAAARLGTADAAPWAARAKAFAIEMGIPMTRKAIRTQGGTGFMREGGTERFARDVRSLQFLGEPVHMQRDVVKRALLDLEYEAAP